MLFHIISVVEELAYQVAVFVVWGGKLVVLLLCDGIHSDHHELSVLLVEEIHVTMGSIMVDRDLRFHSCQL